MTPEQALQMLNEAVAMASMSRAQHIQIQQAVEVLGTAIQRLKAHTDGEPKPEGEEGAK